MDCKKALAERRATWRRRSSTFARRGRRSAAKRADRAAKEGIIVTRVARGRQTRSGGGSELRDRLRRPERGFRPLRHQRRGSAGTRNPGVAGGAAREDGRREEDREQMNDLLAKVGEKMDIRRFEDAGLGRRLVSAYTHMGSKIGVLVEFSGLAVADTVSGVGTGCRDAGGRHEPAGGVARADRQGARWTGNSRSTGRRPRTKESRSTIVERIATGRLEKFYQEACLADQTFIKDPGKTVKDILQDAGAKSGATVAVNGSSDSIWARSRSRIHGRPGHTSGSCSSSAASP